MRALVVLAFVLAACTPGFDNPTLVKDLRPLAMTVDPPEILLENLQSSPEPFPDLIVTPLVARPNSDGLSVHIDLFLCGNDADVNERGRTGGPASQRDNLARGACPPDSPQVASADVPVVDASAVHTFTFKLTVDLLNRVLGGVVDVRALLALDPARIAQLVPTGFPVRVYMVASVGDERVEMIKRVVFYPRLEPAQTPNANPTLEALELSHDRGTTWLPFDPRKDTLEVPAGKTLWLRPVFAPSVERYRANTYDQGAGGYVLKDAQEVLRYAFFTAAGRFAPGQIATDPLEIYERPPPFRTEYSAPLTLPMNPSEADTLWIVVRDERAGSSFVRARLSITP